jgi:myosin heavy subunit
LLFSVFFWVFFGWLADYSFPFGQALELFLSCFTGTVAAKINSLQQQLQRTDVIPQPDNAQQVQKLNKLESQAWLYKGILERLGADPSANHEKIAKTLEALEYKRSEILQELEPRRPRSYRVLVEIQDSAREFLASQAEKDYEQLQKVVINLILFMRSRQPSQIILSEAITRLASEIAQSGNQISPYRLRLAYRIDELLRVLSVKLVLNSNSPKTDGNYQSLVNELHSRINLLSQEFNNLLRVRQQDKNELNRRTQEISNLTKSISDLHKDISNRDADIAALRSNIQSLTESVQEKQVQINSLQNSIRSLQRDVQNSADLDRKKQDQINQLQSQLSQLNQQKSSLQKRIEDLYAYARNKESEVEDLQNERSQLNSQKLELQRQNQILYQNYQRQQGEISSLNQQVEEFSRTNRARSQKSTPQPLTRTVATQEKISEAEYQRITNQNEYEYVSGYTNSRSGKWVDPYYRRKRNR